MYKVIGILLFLAVLVGGYMLANGGFDSGPKKVAPRYSAPSSDDKAFQNLKF